MAHRLGGRGGQRGQERDVIHLIITMKGLAVMMGGVKFLEVEVK